MKIDEVINQALIDLDPLAQGVMVGLMVIRLEQHE